MGLEKYDANKEVKIRLTQESIKGNLYLAFDRFTSMASDADYAKRSKLKNADSDGRYVGRRVEVYVLEMEDTSTSLFRFKKPRVKHRTHVETIKVDKPEDRMIFLKDMINIRKGFCFEETKYYKTWETERYLDCKVEETANELLYLERLA